MSKYFVSYFWKTFFREGYGMCAVGTDKSMDTMDGVIDVKEAIRKKHRFRECIIINYKKLGDSDAEEQTS